jgi:glyoxylase-like metal-dependent hydrolase (beta-lactamase superfamily II)
MKLPGNTRLLPGHGPPTTLAHELQTNPYVQRALEEPDEK